MKNVFKLYPWEWIVEDEFGKNILLDVNRPFWIEPAWKMLLSNKAILPILWELYPDHPNLLPAYFEPGKLTSFVRKPILGREGANIRMEKEGTLLQSSEGVYGKEGYVFQELFYCPNLIAITL